MLAGKKAVVTGGSGGIGFAIADAFVRNGSDVCIISRSKEKCETACKHLEKWGKNVKFILADFTDVSAVSAVAAEIIKKWGNIDILVNNAGVAIFSKFKDVDEEEFDKQIKLNFKSPYFFIQKMLPALIEQKSSIINISSYFAQRVLPQRPSSVYSASKGAINSLTKALAYELGPLGIRVNAIAPGTVNTALVRKNIGVIPEKERGKFWDGIKTIYPMGRIGEPEDIGGIAVYLASDEASWVTGSIINIDGGLTTN